MAKKSAVQFVDQLIMFNLVLLQFSSIDMSCCFSLICHLCQSTLDLYIQMILLGKQVL